MIRAKKLSLVTARRTLRALYAQTQGYPYAANLRTASGSQWNDSTKNQSTLTAFGQAGSVAQIFPGASMTLYDDDGTTFLGAETVDLGYVDSKPFGLSANFVGGDLDELSDLGEIGVWRGRGSVWIVLAPVFSGTPADGDIIVTAARGQLLLDNTPTAGATVGQCLDNIGPNAIILDLQVP